MMLLGIWLIIMGVTSFVSIAIPGALTGALALIAGVLIIIGM